MKAKLAILVLLSAAPWVYAGSTVPKLMSYQGRVTDSAGVAIGNTAAVNRTVTFSLYASPSGNDLSYRETQSVTISGGEFSVLIGNGTGVPNYPGPTSPASSIKTLDGVINSAATSALYLGITVDDGNSATQDTEISPRQQLVTGAYSVRSLMAESVASGAVTSTMLGDSSVGTNQIAAGSINSVKLGALAVESGNILGGAVTAAKIDTTTVGVWTPSGNNIYRSSNVGIGVTSPAAVLEVAARTGTTTTPATNGLRVVNSTNTAGNNAVLAAGVAGSSAGSPFVSLDISGINGWSIGTDNVDADKLVFKNSWDFTANPKMAIDTFGNVGIGTTAPVAKLDVNGVGRFGSDSAKIGFVDVGFYGDSGNIALRAPAAGSTFFQSASGANTWMFITNGGNVGVNTTSPDVKFSVAGGIRAGGGVGTLPYPGGYSFASPGDSDGGMFSPSDGTLTWLTDGSERMRLSSSGRLGIGNTSPLAPLHVSGSSSLTVNQQGYLGSGGAGDCNNQSHVGSYGIYCDSNIVAAGFDATSDSRIKTDLLVTDNAADLEVLLGIQITNYHHKDSLMNGNRPQKKVIAQQVESVYPQAVTGKTGVIPDIFTGAKTRDGWVMLVTDLKVGDKVRLLADKESPVQEVLEVRVGAFRTAFTPKDADVFVYGREVDDFRSVDYDAIAMLNVSATQELAKKLEQKDVELEQKDAVIAALEARMSALEKRVFGAK